MVRLHYLTLCEVLMLELEYLKDSDTIRFHYQPQCKVVKKFLNVVEITECSSTNPLVAIRHPLGLNLTKQILNKFDEWKKK